MPKPTDQSTRLLCASALLGHGRARQKIIDWFQDPNRAVALELGVDLRLAVQVARYAEARNRRYWWAYFTVAFLTLLASATVGVGLALLGALAASAIWARRKIQERNSLASMFWPELFDSDVVANRFPADLEAEELSALPSSDQNFFVYGGFLPFVGAGHDLGGWSVAVALDKSKEQFGQKETPQPFTIEELYANIDSGLDQLDLAAIEKRDCYFANGIDVRGNRPLLPDIFGRPSQRLEPEVAAQYIFKDDEKVRHYRCYRIIGWGGELALSYYLRCSRRGNTLFVETKRFLLTPVASEYRAVDNMVPTDLHDVFAVVVTAVFVGPSFAVVSPVWAIVELRRLWRDFWGSEDKERRELIERNPLFNYGTVQSLRQSLSSPQFRHYFQKIDGDFYNKLFEREVLDSLVEFLDDHNIDTSDLKERQTTILNSGVIVQGGDVNAESLAVGPGAEAIKNVTKRVFGVKSETEGAGK